MELNKATIPHYHSEIIPTNKLKKRVLLNEEYLREKPTWYEIEGKLQYFKIRNDFRLFTEQFYSMFGREILGLDTIDYQVAYVRTKDPVVKQSEEVTKCGLLSENFQDPTKYNYYLVSELMKSKISDFIMYGGYTLQNLLAFFNDYLDKKEYKECELFLIKLFIGDGFTHQEDRNFNNIGFQIPKIEGIPYTKRLHSEILRNNPNAINSYTINEEGRILLKDFSPSKVYDSERIFGFDHKNVFNYRTENVWCPLFPFSNETLFETQEEAQKVQLSYDGLDPNLCELFFTYPDICKPIFERLVYDDEYRKILERFRGNTRQINLDTDEEERIIHVCEDKREVFKRILEL